MTLSGSTNVRAVRIVTSAKSVRPRRPACRDPEPIPLWSLWGSNLYLFCLFIVALFKITLQSRWSVRSFGYFTLVAVNINNLISLIFSFTSIGVELRKTLSWWVNTWYVIKAIISYIPYYVYAPIMSNPLAPLSSGSQSISHFLYIKGKFDCNTESDSLYTNTFT